MILVKQNHQVDELISRVAYAQSIVYDAETSGLDWKRNHIIGHVLTFGPGNSDTYYVPVRHAVHTIFHNGAFDMGFLHRIGWKPVGALSDTMIMAYLENELRPSMSLDACCKDLRVQAKRGQPLYDKIAEIAGVPADRRSMGHLWKLPGDLFEVVDYSCGDGTSTWQLYNALLPKMYEPYYSNSRGDFSLKRVHDLEHDLMPVIHNMSMRGIKIDEKSFEALYGETEAALEQALDSIGEVNVRSGPQLRKYFEDHGVSGWPITDKGNPSFTEPFLKSSEPGRAILTVRKNRTLMDSFLRPMKERHIKDGRLYLEFSQTRDEQYGTRTGRLSAHNPNIQAMPGKRQGDLGKRFRKIFIADDDRTWVSADFETCEIVICAHYCKAKLWVDGFESGVDPHTSVAEALSIDRRHAKAINLGLMTGMGREKLAEDLGVPQYEGDKILHTYFTGLPELRKFQNQSKAAFANRGFVSTLLGRRLRLEKSKFAYKAVNRLTQGGNADIIKERMVAMARLADEIGVNLILNVHDDISFQCDTKDQAEKMVECMKDMSGVELSLPMGVSWGIGSNWGDASFSEEGWT
jgi:DNA polymerase-1